MHAIKLNLKRIDSNNYVSILSPSSQKKMEEKYSNNTPTKNANVPTTPKMSSRKSLRWSERNENVVMNLVEKLMNDSDIEEDETLNTPKKQKRKPTFGDCIDINEVDHFTPEKKHTRSFFSYRANKLKNISDAYVSDTPKSTRKSINQISEQNNLNDIEIPDTPKSNLVRKSSVTLSTPSKSKNIIDTFESGTPKRIRKSVNRYGEAVDDFNDIEIPNTPKSNRVRKSSVTLSTPSKSKNIIDTFESGTPKRIRKSVNRYGEAVDDFNELETINDTKIEKFEDEDYEIKGWKTPVNKHTRIKMTPTTYSGSKIRRNILQGIPESKEIEVISTPKTPRKTPKAHVKNLIASATKRSDNGARVPCSPLEIARASLHLHAAPKHLPCREVEFKSIHSFLSRKINDELTGSMYISGVPGTGKTATVKRVIDSLNSDLIMKHSFKFIEINGLRLANPHQAFSVIWKELTGQTVSSSRAQAFLNDYFSDQKVKDLSTILLVDEVDHICNRKQDVVYNILDWPSKTNSKVVVITIANTMDLPERVLRGCVTSRMGLTRLVFKPYTFQQLQEIIMNRLSDNSSFDPDAVQLVARKVAAISGDARRALDICRRAIDLIQSEDDSQLISINHVNRVLNSILSGVRVTAIRYCTLLEQFFLKALRDETIRTGFDHGTIDSIYNQMKHICLFEGEELPNNQEIIKMAYRLRDSGLIFLEKKRCDMFRKVTLNVSPEDINYALDKHNNY
ncbi:Hypothetical protein CINCED_3A015113 [Cinara cedri]|nr:Hypothetical protein CINCED_3A015113 [Cinara cedri]